MVFLRIKRRNRRFQVAARALLAAVSLAFSTSIRADAIPGLFNTGVDNLGVLLADGTVDPHYTLTVSADPIDTGPSAFVVTPNGFPFPPWIAQGPNSKWIAPKRIRPSGTTLGPTSTGPPSALRGSDKPATATISGQYSTDNNGLDILINGVSTGQTTPLYAYTFFLFCDHLGLRGRRKHDRLRPVQRSGFALGRQSDRPSRGNVGHGGPLCQRRHRRLTSRRSHPR